jgi:hypothetical protein
VKTQQRGSLIAGDYRPSVKAENMEKDLHFQESSV